jgi:hypothetical protein
MFASAETGSQLLTATPYRGKIEHYLNIEHKYECNNRFGKVCVILKN